MSLRLTIAAMMAMLLTCAVPSCLAVDTDPHKSERARLVAHLSRIGDKEHAPLVAEAFDRLELYRKFLIDALRLIETEVPSAGADPELQNWKARTETSIRSYLKELESTNKTHTENLLQLNRKSSLDVRVWTYNRYRVQANLSLTTLRGGVGDAMRALPIASADVEMKAFEQSVRDAIQWSDSSPPLLRSLLDGVVARYLSQFGRISVVCHHESPTALAVERENLRVILRETRDAWSRRSVDTRPDAAGMASIDRLEYDILSREHEDQIIARQAFTRGRYCLDQYLHDLDRELGPRDMLELLPEFHRM